jgi:hypothetical protein
VRPIVMQLSTTMCVMLLFAHVAACTLVLAAKLEGFPEGSWMVQYGQLTDPLFIPTTRVHCMSTHFFHGMHVHARHEMEGMIEEYTFLQI